MIFEETEIIINFRYNISVVIKEEKVLIFMGMHAETEWSVKVSDLHGLANKHTHLKQKSQLLKQATVKYSGNYCTNLSC